MVFSARSGFLRAAAAVAVCGLFLLATASCRRSSPNIKNGTTEKEECETILESAMGMAHPLKLGVTTSIEGVVNRLNDWRRTCPEPRKIPAGLDDDAKKLMAAVLSKSELAAMQNEAYDELDARHVRNSLVFVRIADSANAPRELDQVVDLFYYVVRNVELVERGPGAAPRPVFRTLLFGQGTAADRAWLFAAILRQLKISAVVISPQKTSAANGSPFLVGVLLSEQGKQQRLREAVYLFDPHLGLPVPAPDDDRSGPLIRKPATLAQFVADPKIAASLSTKDYKYGLTAGDLQKPRVQLIGHRSLWSPRMKRLYHTIGGAYKAVLFEELSGKQGLIARTLEFGKGTVSRDDIGIWPYPHQQLAAFANMNESQRMEMANLERPFEAPREVMVDKTTGKAAINKTTGKAVLGPQSRLQLRARIRHMMGEYDKAVTSYVSVQSQSRAALKDHFAQLPIAEREMLVRADEDAHFWIGLCKYELEDFGTASVRFTEMKRSRKWSLQASFLLALCEVKQKKYASARSELDELIKRKPLQAHGCAVLWQRWNSLGRTAPGNNPPKAEVPQKKSSG